VHSELIVKIRRMSKYVASHYLTKTARSQPSQHTGDEDPLIGELLEVLCINCQDYIGIEAIEDHSRACTVVRPEVVTVESAGQLEAVKLKVSKLYNYLFTISNAGDVSPGEKNYLLIMQRNCGRLISVTDLSHKNENAAVLNDLETLSKHVKKSACLVIYVERLKGLAKEQKLVIDELELETQKPKEMTLEEQLAFYKNKSAILEDALKLARNQYKESNKQTVDEVMSETSSRISDTGSMLSSLDYTATSHSSETETDIFPTTKLDFGEPDDEQKLFYSQCLSIKLALSSHHNVENIAIYSIYAKAKAQRIPMSEWKEFIRSEILSKSDNRADSKRGLRRRFQYVDT